jgi:mannose-1-phosphate guanylyltransferase/mannose-6-phosphate isomerase
MTKTIVPVILCGGSGTRLWPISREGLPKQFLSLTGSGTLLQNTAERALRIAGASQDRIMAVTLEALRDEVTAQLEALSPDMARHILGEPSARNTAAAVAYAALYAAQRFGNDAYLWILPSDHHIGDDEALAYAFRAALDAAAQDHLVTFGIQPTRPETGYGYIRIGESLNGAGALHARAFVEKPSREVARSYLESGDYLWNSGMFLFRAGTVLENFRTHSPEILDQVEQALAVATSADRVDADLYGRVAEQPFDKAIMEKSPQVAVVPCDPAWSDIGGFESLWEIRQKDSNGNVLEGPAEAEESRNCLVLAQDRLVACVGVEDLVIAETGDAILVADRKNGDALRTMVKRLKGRGRREITTPTRESKPWGLSKTVSIAPDYAVRELTVHPGAPLSHKGSDLYWIVLSGEALVELASGIVRRIKPMDTIFAHAEEICSLSAADGAPLRLLEVRFTPAQPEATRMDAPVSSSGKAAA